PVLDRQDGRREKHDRISPQIACSPAVMAPWAFGHTKRHHPGHSRRQSRQRMHHEREEEGEWKAIDHPGVPFCKARPIITRGSRETSIWLLIAYRGEGANPLTHPLGGKYRGRIDSREVKFLLISPMTNVIDKRPVRSSEERWSAPPARTLPVHR